MTHGRGGPLTTGPQFSSLQRDVEEAGGTERGMPQRGGSAAKMVVGLGRKNFRTASQWRGKTTEGETRRKDKGTQKKYW